MSRVKRKLLLEIDEFANSCEIDLLNETHINYVKEQTLKYINALTKDENHSIFYKRIIDKLEFILFEIKLYKEPILNDEKILTLSTINVTNYIINRVKEKKISDVVLIARFVYIELSKILYYDISYFRQEDRKNKETICHAKIDVKNEKIFSYVTCSQWLQLYQYILETFGILVDEKNVEGHDHVWGEIKLDNDNIIIADATCFVNSSIDFSNAKSNVETVGFVILPKYFSGLSLYNIFNSKTLIKEAEIVKECYMLNRELDQQLGYIKKNMYKDEQIINENELFHNPELIITNKNDFDRYLEKTIDFFRKLEIPQNMDGYELYAYYYKYIRKIPKCISKNIFQETLYVDSFEYKLPIIKERYSYNSLLYLKYLEQLVYDRYYRYLIKNDRYKLLNLSRIKLNNNEIEKAIADYETMIRQINKELNLYYAINKLQFLDYHNQNIIEIQLFEPLLGKNIFVSDNEYIDLKTKIKKN